MKIPHSNFFYVKTLARHSSLLKTYLASNSLPWKKTWDELLPHQPGFSSTETKLLQVSWNIQYNVPDWWEIYVFIRLWFSWSTIIAEYFSIIIPCTLYNENSSLEHPASTQNFTSTYLSCLSTLISTLTFTEEVFVDMYSEISFLPLTPRITKLHSCSHTAV